MKGALKNRFTMTTQKLDSQDILESISTELVRIGDPLHMRDLERSCQVLGIRGHVAVMAEPYLTKILKGEKTVESRFLNRRGPPYGKLRPGMLIFLKEVSGPIRGIALISAVQDFGPLRSGEAGRLMREHQDELCIELPFLKRKQNSRYATLISIGSLRSTPDIRLEKKDRRAWVVLRCFSDDVTCPTAFHQLSFADSRMGKCESSYRVFPKSKQEKPSRRIP
jgi:hypothetical protein